MEDHYRVNPYEYDSTHAVKFSEWVFVPQNSYTSGANGFTCFDFMGANASICN